MLKKLAIIDSRILKNIGITINDLLILSYDRKEIVTNEFADLKLEPHPPTPGEKNTGDSFLILSERSESKDKNAL